jgi:hypothetical protein
MNPRTRRRLFLVALRAELRVVWPILSGLFVIIVALGIAVGVREGWSLQDSVYFSFVTGLTIGYGDLVPKTLLSRILSALIGLTGILVTALVAAVAVKALPSARGDDKS